VARILIVAGGCRGRELARSLAAEGHVLRITTRSEDGRAAIEDSGAECWVGTPERPATLRGSLAGVTFVCWLLARASGSEQALAELHTARLESFLTQVIDSPVRGFLYEAPEGVPQAATLSAGERILARLSARNAIPTAVLRRDPAAAREWLGEARAAVEGLLLCR
jgi:uncharacterized protein YbjT (DUF2867 family)